MILAFDPSTTNVGYAIYEDTLPFSLTLGHITPKDKDLKVRYKIISRKIKELLEERKPDIVGIETSFFGRNVGVTSKLSVVRGIITGLVYSLTEASIFEVTPAEERKAVGLPIRKADKVEVHKALKWQFKEYFEKFNATEDEMDALAVALSTKIKAKEAKYLEEYKKVRNKKI